MKEEGNDDDDDDDDDDDAEEEEGLEGAAVAEKRGSDVGVDVDVVICSVTGGRETLTGITILGVERKGLPNGIASGSSNSADEGVGVVAETSGGEYEEEEGGGGGT